MCHWHPACITICQCHPVSVSPPPYQCHHVFVLPYVSVTMCQCYPVPVSLCQHHCVSVTLCHLVAAFVLLRVCGEVRVDKTKRCVMKLETYCHSPLVTLKHTNQSAVSYTQPSAPVTLYCSSTWTYTHHLSLDQYVLCVEYEPFKLLNNWPIILLHHMSTLGKFFTLHCSSSLSCIDEYLAIDNGGLVVVTLR